MSVLGALGAGLTTAGEGLVGLSEFREKQRQHDDWMKFRRDELATRVSEAEKERELTRTEGAATRTTQRELPGLRADAEGRLITARGKEQRKTDDARIKSEYDAWNEKRDRLEGFERENIIIEEGIQMAADERAGEEYDRRARGDLGRQMNGDMWKQLIKPEIDNGTAVGSDLAANPNTMDDEAFIQAVLAKERQIIESGTDDRGRWVGEGERPSGSELRQLAIDAILDNISQYAGRTGGGDRRQRNTDAAWGS